MSNFIFLKNINIEIYEDAKLAEKKYKKNPRITIGLSRSILEKSLKFIYKNKWKEIEKQNLGNILTNKDFINQIQLTDHSIKKMDRIRILGNKALHETTSTITEVDALEILEYLFSVLKELFNCSDISFNKKFLSNEINNQKELQNIFKYQKNYNKILIIFLSGIFLIISIYFYILNKNISNSQDIKKTIEIHQPLEITKEIKNIQVSEDKLSSEDKLIKLIEKNYQKYFEKPENLDLNSYYFTLDDNKIKLSLEPQNPYWLKDIEWMEWKPTAYNNFFLGNFIIKNKIPFLFIRELGWRGLIYEVYLIPQNENINTLMNYLIKNIGNDNIESYLNDTYEKVHPLDFDIFSFKNIFQYENYYYILSRTERNRNDLTHFNIVRLDISPHKIIYEKTFPSFNYNKNLTLDEKIVYNTPKLATLDKELSKNYQDTKMKLTGVNKNNLIEMQKEFLKNRRKLGDNIFEIEKLYNKRIKEIELELETESKRVKKVVNVNPKILKSLNGVWESKKYIPGNSKISSHVDTRINQKIEYDYPYITLKKNSHSLKIEKYKIIDSKLANSYELIDEYNKYQDRNHSYTELPYLLNYALIKCENIKTKEIINLVYTYDDEGNGNLFLGMVKDDDSIFLDYGSQYIESQKLDLVVSGGYFKKIIDPLKITKDNFQEK